MRSWDDTLERECQALVGAICDPSTERRERERSWRELMTRVAPHVEQWARTSPLLRRCRLDGEDDVRGVLIAVMTRLSQRDHENLHQFLARQPSADPDDDDAGATPLRGWLLGLVRFASKDHVKQRLGWSGPAPETPVEGRQASKRDAGTDAARFDDLLESGARPPMTDLLTRRRLVEEVMAHAATFPPQMQGALQAWLRDASYDDIADELGLESADDARALVRAAQARLRDHLRGK